VAKRGKTGRMLEGKNLWARRGSERTIVTETCPQKRGEEWRMGNKSGGSTGGPKSFEPLVKITASRNGRGGLKR